MNDKLDLCCLVEGSRETLHIFVCYDDSNGKPVDVEDLTKIIFKARCKHLADNHNCLTLSKVGILVSISSVSSDVS
jgi:hypothetical protein